MRKNDISVTLILDFAVACSLLTRLPVPRIPASAYDRQSTASWAFPLVGALIGSVSAAAAFVSLKLGLPTPVAAGVFIFAQIILTGAMHEDGLADTADGLWGGWTRERRLEIMKDSAIGTYGVLSLILVVGLRWTAIAAILPTGFLPLIATAALSRMGLPVIMAVVPHARSEGLSFQVGSPDRNVVAASIITAVLAGWGLVGPVVIGVALGYALVLTLVSLIAKARIGGQTGDILGAAQQVGEIAILFGLIAFL